MLDLVIPPEVAIIYRAALLCSPDTFLDNEPSFPDWTLPKAPTKADLVKATDAEQLPVFCMACLHKLGYMEGGLVRHKCHKCEPYGYNNLAWRKVGFISAKAMGWGSDRVWCKVYKDTPPEFIEAAHKRLIAYYRSNLK